MFYFILSNKFNKKIISLGTDDVWNIVPENLNSNSKIVSAGVGKAVSFELDLIRIFNCKVLVFDPSEVGFNTTKNLNTHNFIYNKIGLSDISGLVSFADPDDINEGSLKIANNSNAKIQLECTTLVNIMNENNWNEIDLLKMDIEGFEYKVLNHIIDNKINVKQICVEFHTNKFIDINQNYYDLIFILIKLYIYGYRLIYKTGYDYTFIKETH